MQSVLLRRGRHATAVSSLLFASIIGAAAPAGAADPAASPATLAKQAEVLKSLPFEERADFERVHKGFIATTPDKKLHDKDGNPRSDLDSSAFYARPAPDTVNPSLWRNSQLLAEHGLFKVTDRVYQIRGYGISNMTIIVGKTGYIVVDPGSTDAARTGMELIGQHLGVKPVVAVIYTHSHADHYGGVRGLLTDEDAKARKVPILAPKGFLREVASEWVIAGPAMSRRIRYQAGGGLPFSDTGSFTLGIGPKQQPIRDPNAPRPTGGGGGGSSLPIAPTREISTTGEIVVLDGVRFEFQVTPGTEATAEMNFYLPDFKALCLSENANGSMHNLLAPRGVQVRDAKGWADYLTESIRLYGDRTDVLFTSHFWPYWGRAEIIDYLEHHRDAYKFLHDQSVRLINDGFTESEIAERLVLPPELGSKWYNRDYYGTMSHNSKAVYQRYMGWYDANPANLNALPDEVSAPRYVAALGGREKVQALARQAADAGDYRWAAELLNKLVFAEPANQSAKGQLADVYKQLAYQAESSNWRNIYLTGADELVNGTPPSKRVPAFQGLKGMPLDLFLDAISVRLSPDRAKGVATAFTVVDPSTGNARLVKVKNSVLIHEAVTLKQAEGPVVKLTDSQFQAILAGETDAGLPAESGQLLKSFASLFDGPLSNFAIVTP